MIIGGIVLYNPDVERLLENIKAIYLQVDLVVLVDNGSNSFSQISNVIIEQYEDITFIKNPVNIGIASALNQLMRFGLDNGAEWVLTLDQDSVCPNDIIKNYLKYTDIQNIGIICPIINDRSFGYVNNGIQQEVDYSYIDVCITSASLTSVKAWNDVGGFDETMFIDGVDTDFCLSLKEHGYRIIQCNGVSLLHEIGHNSKIVSILGHVQVVFNHSAFRYYYICRNIIYNNRKHRGNRPSPLRGLITVLFRFLLVLVYENNKIVKSKAIIKGLIAGFKSPIKRGLL